MIIRSQDKKELVNYNKCERIRLLNPIENSEVHNDFEIHAIFQNDYLILAHYTTEKQAMEVLDEIYNSYASYTATNNEDFAFIPPKVYQMPPDETEGKE